MRSFAGTWWDDFNMTKTVLVVDDDPTQRRLIQAVLERDGFAVAQADSGDAAMSHLQAGKPADVVLLDLQMPACRVTTP